mmetsp:Transcript_21512/g.59582  ORF Transcript_21512/g.59582 Transcript_21512/m.59582 type:complete len:208 (-) Transcript_21512:2120-2743(-)
MCAAPVNLNRLLVCKLPKTLWPLRPKTSSVPLSACTLFLTIKSSASLQHTHITPHHMFLQCTLTRYMRNLQRMLWKPLCISGSQPKLLSPPLYIRNRYNRRNMLAHTQPTHARLCVTHMCVCLYRITCSLSVCMIMPVCTRHRSGAAVHVALYVHLHLTSCQVLRPAGRGSWPQSWEQGGQQQQGRRCWRVHQRQPPWEQEQQLVLP